MSSSGEKSISILQLGFNITLLFFKSNVESSHKYQTWEITYGIQDMNSVVCVFLKNWFNLMFVYSKSKALWYWSDTEDMPSKSFYSIYIQILRNTVSC